MQRNIKALFIFALMVLTACSTSESGTAREVVPGIPVKNTVTLVDLGAKTCIPCKMMAPLLEELKEEYKGRAEIIFIDVWENRELARKFKISSIPTQIFYDKNSSEVFRHIGFMDKESMTSKIEELRDI